MSKKNGNVSKKKCRSVFFLWPPTTYGNEAVSVGGHKKNKDLRNCSRLSKHCTKPAFENEMLPTWEDQITATAMVAVAAADEHYDTRCM